MKVKIEDWEAFLAVAKEQNFARAAKKIGLSAPMLSKRITRLEKELETRLFQRTTRSVALTHEGENLLPRLSDALDTLADVESVFEEGRDETELRGPVRLTAPVVYSQRVLPSVLAGFLRLHPNVEVEIIASDSILNLVDEHIDMAIRMGDMKDSSLIARPIGQARLVACASPAYLKSAPPLRVPADLKKHNLLFMDLHRDLVFQGTRTTVGEVTGRRSFQSNDGVVLTELALQGAGVAIRSVWNAMPHLKTGQLKLVLNDYPMEGGSNVWLLLPSRRNITKRVRALTDYLAAELPGK